MAADDSAGDSSESSLSPMTVPQQEPTMLPGIGALGEDDDTPEEECVSQRKEKAVVTEHDEYEGSEPEAKRQCACYDESGDECGIDDCSESDTSSPEPYQDLATPRALGAASVMCDMRSWSWALRVEYDHAINFFQVQLADYGITFDLLMHLPVTLIVNAYRRFSIADRLDRAAATEALFMGYFLMMQLHSGNRD